MCFAARATLPTVTNDIHLEPDELLDQFEPGFSMAKQLGRAVGAAIDARPGGGGEPRDQAQVRRRRRITPPTKRRPCWPFTGRAPAFTGRAGAFSAPLLGVVPPRP